MNQNYSDFFDKLRKTLEADEFNNAEFGSLDKSEFWRQLLEYMDTDKSSSSGIEKKHSPLFDGEVKGEDLTTLFDYINKTSDLDSTETNPDNIYTTRLFNYIKGQLDIGNYDENSDSGFSNPQKSLWNESINKVLVYFLKKILPGNTSFIPTEGPGVFLHHDIAKADAGWDYKDSKYTEWVKPFNNIDYDGTAPDFYRGTYSYVRGDDAIQSVLSDISESQFTRDPQDSPGISDGESNRWIRLIMPKYTRNVEVEDLNRNFWVISQVLTAICAYLFWENSPILDELKRILSELTQLWENVLYLWATAAILSQKPVTEKIHTEIIYLSNNEFQDFFKFDDFNQIDITQNKDDLWEVINKRLSYLKEMYTDSNLCIMPVIRDDNYKHNYYGKEYYPGLYLYMKDYDAEGNIDFVFDSEQTPGILDGEFVISADNFKNTVWGLHESEDKYQVYRPFSDEAPTSDSYFSLIRPIFDIDEVSLSDNLNQTWTFIFGVTITLIDVVKDLYKSVDSQINSEIRIVGTQQGFGDADSASIKITRANDKNIIVDSSTNDRVIFSIKNKHIPTTSSYIIQEPIFDITKGFYAGELISQIKRGDLISWKVQYLDGKLLRVYKEVDKNAIGDLYNDFHLSSKLFDVTDNDFDTTFSAFQNAYFNTEIFTKNVDYIQTYAGQNWLDTIYGNDFNNIFSTWLADIDSNYANNESISALTEFFPSPTAIDNPDLTYLGNQVILFVYLMECLSGAEIISGYNSSPWGYGTQQKISEYDNKFIPIGLDSTNTNKIKLLTLSRATSGDYGLDEPLTDKNYCLQNIMSNNQTAAYSMLIPGRSESDYCQKGAYIEMAGQRFDFNDYVYYNYLNGNSAINYMDALYYNFSFQMSDKKRQSFNKTYIMKKANSRLDFNTWLIVYVHGDYCSCAPEIQHSNSPVQSYTDNILQCASIYGFDQSLTPDAMEDFIQLNLETNQDKINFWNQYRTGIDTYISDYPEYLPFVSLQNYALSGDANIHAKYTAIRDQVNPSITFEGNNGTETHYFVTASKMVDQISVAVLRWDGAFAQKIYKRDFTKLMDDLDNNTQTFKWEVAYEKTYDNGGQQLDIDDLRDGYVFESNSINDSHSLEMFKSNGTGPAGRPDDGFPLDDDYNSLFTKYQNWQWQGSYGD